MRLLGAMDRAAAEVGLTYYLAYGTALGAVREGDLIAWDVDADVWVRHEDRVLLTSAFREALPADVELLTAETHPDYEYLFPRLAFRGIHHVYVRVDVFPLDPAPRSSLGRAVYGRTMRVLDRAFFVKRSDDTVRDHYSPRKRLLLRGLRTLLVPVPDRALRSAFRWLQGRGSPRRLVNSCGSYGAREFFDAAWFDEIERVAVRGRPLPVPIGHRSLLRQVYGDYGTPVPPEQQEREVRAATSSFVVPLRRAGHLPGPEEAP